MSYNHPIAGEYTVQWYALCMVGIEDLKLDPKFGPIRVQNPNDLGPSP